MDDSPSSSHPLEVPWTNLSLVSFKVFVIKGSLEHICDRLEASMGMVGETRGQLDLKEVHHEEWAEFGKFAISEYTEHSGTDSFILPLRLEH